MKAITIDPKTKKIEEVEKSWDLEELHYFIDGYIENGSISPGLAVYVDEEGLLKNIESFFRLPEITTDWLAGKAVLLGYDSMGEGTDCPLSLEEVKDYICFATRDEVLSIYVRERA